MKSKTNITTLDQILDKKYGKKGQSIRDKWEQEFEAFHLAFLLEETRTKLGITEQEIDLTTT